MSTVVVLSGSLRLVNSLRVMVYLTHKFLAEIQHLVCITICFAKNNENCNLGNPLFKGFLVAVLKSFIRAETASRIGVIRGMIGQNSRNYAHRVTTIIITKYSGSMFIVKGFRVQSAPRKTTGGDVSPEGKKLNEKVLIYFNCFKTSAFSINPVFVQISVLFL